MAIRDAVSNYWKQHPQLNSYPWHTETKMELIQQSSVHQRHYSKAQVTQCDHHDEQNRFQGKLLY